MIIELVGMPGAGKTTLAEALKARGAVTASVSSCVRLIVDASLFLLSHPVLARKLLFFILLKVPSDIRYTIFINGYLGYSAQYRKARALSRGGAIVVLDQGFTQLFLSLNELSEYFLNLFPKPDVLVVVAADVVTRESRMASRGWAPREELGTESRLAWQQNAERKLDEVLSSLENVVQIYRYDGSQDPEKGAATLLEVAMKKKLITVQTSSIRNLFKTSVAIVSFLIAQCARIFSRTPQVVVLMYHSIDRSGWKLSVTPEEFERQIRYLARKGWAVPLTDVVAYAKGETKLSAHAVAITFDDGYQDLSTTVLPIIKKYKIPVTVFVPSDISVRSGERAKRNICTWEDLRMLQRTDLVSVESHSRTHAHLSRLSPHELTEEMGGSADDIERELGIRPRYHAYPYGERSPEIEAEAAKTYEAAFSITEGTIRPGDDLFHLRRVQIDSTMNFLLFRLRLTRAVDWNRRVVDVFRAMMPI